VNGDKPNDEDAENQHVIIFESQEVQEKKYYSYLWISEKYFL
jgi:hypothetical protein